MPLVSKVTDIWELRPTQGDLLAGAKYAAITLPWTFNRMMHNTGSQGQQLRALNIAKGIVAQEVLKRALNGNGVHAEVQRKSHRAKDLFDFRVPIGARVVTLDVKSQNYYKDYADLGRAPLSPKLILRHASYAGPEWHKFFPNLVPHTQIKQAKEGYCFAITSSIDFRKDIDTDRHAHALTAFPYGPHLVFYSSKRLCEARESAGEGFGLRCSYTATGLFAAEAIEFCVVGEWDGEIRRERVKLTSGGSTDVGPFSCINSFELDRPMYDKFEGRVAVSVVRNAFTSQVLSPTRQNLNAVPRSSFRIVRQDFCNLILPTDYTVYVVGWILKEDFLAGCRRYTGWVWPSGAIDKSKNQAWTQITQADKATIARAGFEDCIQKKPSLLKAGWMKTHGRGGGASCYVYPGIGMRGGVRETNLYVLPQDLHTMASLGK